MKSLKILIVDDEQDLRELMIDLLSELERDGMTLEFVEATNGQEGLDQLNGVNLILTDHRMPKMTGAEMIKALRSDGNETPVILISGFAEEAVNLIRSEPGISVMDKPVTLANLEERLNHALGFA